MCFRQAFCCCFLEEASLVVHTCKLVWFHILIFHPHSNHCYHKINLHLCQFISTPFAFDLHDYVEASFGDTGIPYRQSLDIQGSHLSLPHTTVMRNMLKALNLLPLTHFFLLGEALDNKIKTTNKQSHTQSYHLSHCQLSLWSYFFLWPQFSWSLINNFGIRSTRSSCCTTYRCTCHD